MALAEVTASLSLSDWSFEPTVTVGLLAVVVGYVLAWRRGWLRRDNQVAAWLPSSAWRPWLFGVGVVAAAIALQSPIDKGGDEYLFWLHMIQHLLLMSVVPPLLLLGICGAASPRSASPRPTARVAAALLSPWAACLIFNVVLLTWHIPTFYDATLTTAPLHIFEHLTFMVAGVVLWWPVVDPLRATAEAESPTVAAEHSSGAMTKIAMLVVAGLPPTILGFILVMARQPIYTFYLTAPRLWGISAVTDQQVAGVLMLGVGNVIYFIAIAVIFLRLFGDPSADEANAAQQPALAVE